jgi:predicted DNA-binding protein
MSGKQEENGEDLGELAAAQQAARAFARGEIVVDQTAAVPDSDLPPRELAEQPATVVTSLRLPFELYQRLKAAAESRGATMGALLREWAELELAALEEDQPISRADALRALAGIRPFSAGRAA